MHEIFNHTLEWYNSSYVRLHRRSINVTTSNATLPTYIDADLYLTVPPGSETQLSVEPGNNGTFAPPTINIIVPHDNSTLTVRFLTEETSLVGLNTQRCFWVRLRGIRRRC
jgi:hypothetical protein